MQINWLFTCLSPIWSWCGCLHGDYLSYGSWQKQRRMGAKDKQVDLWNQSSKWQLVWSSKDCSIKEGLSTISSWLLCILHKRLVYLNLCWFVPLFIKLSIPPNDSYMRTLCNNTYLSFSYLRSFRCPQGGGWREMQRRWRMGGTSSRGVGIEIDNDGWPMCADFIESRYRLINSWMEW